jgi:glycerol-3-phosphate O-acyltransferase
MLYQNNMPCPHIAAGKNLSFWPLGPLFRRGGAFFIRRTFRGAILYSKVFSEYIHKLLSEGFNIEFFIEGGRSRTGKLLQPKLGFLSILLNAYKNKATEELFFVPIFIGYDRVLEESSYLYELEGGQKKPEDISQVFKARKFLKKRYGRIYIKFHEPYSINNLLEQKGLDIDVMSAKDLNQMCRELGYRVLNAIDRITVATPHAVVASALLNCTKVGFTYDHILKHVETYMNYLFYRDADLADTLLVDHVHAIQTAFSSYVQRKFIERISDEKEAEAADLKYFVASNKRPLLEYYKNTNIALFINAAFTAMSILEKDAFQFSSLQIVDGFSFLQDFFQYEFASDVEKTAEDHVRFNLHAFTSDAILMPHPTMDDTYNMTSAGFRKLNLFARFLIPFFESYWIVLKFLSQSTNDTLEPKERTKKIQNLGNRLYKNKEVYRRESLSGLNYQNALDFFSSKGIKDSGQEEKIEQYDTYIKRYIERIN